MTFNLFKISKLLYTRIDRNVISKKKKLNNYVSV